MAQTDVTSSVTANQRVFAAWGVTVEQQKLALDLMYVAMQKTGIKAADLSGALISMQAILQTSFKFNFEDSVAIIGTFNKAGLDATDTTRGLTKAWATWTKAGEDPKAMLSDLMGRLSDTNTRQQALIETIAIFGTKSAAQIANAAEKGAFAIDGLKKSLDDASGAVDKVNAKATTLEGTWIKLGHQLAASFSPVGEAILKFLIVPMDAFNKSYAKYGSIDQIASRGLARHHGASGSWGDKQPTPADIGTPPPGGGGDAGGVAMVMSEPDKSSFKGLTDLKSSLAVLVDQENLQIAALKSLNSETAKFNEATGASVDQAEYLAIKTAAATLGMADWDKEMPDLAGNLGLTDKATGQLTKTLDGFAAAATAARQAAFDNTVAGKMAIAFKTLGLTVDQVTGSVEKSKDASAEYILLHATSLPQVEAGWAAVAGSISKVPLPESIKLENEYIAALKAHGATPGEVYAAEEAELKRVIALKEQSGQSSSKETVTLTNLQLHTQALATASAGLGGVYSTLMKTADAAFGQVGNAIAKVVVEGGSWGKAMKAIMQSMEEQMLGSLISAILKLAEAWVINLLFGKAAASTAGVAEVLTDAAVGGAAAAASTAAIPIIGPALALEAGAAMYAAIAGTYVPLAMASRGFDVGDTAPLTQLHPYEMVLPADIATPLRSMVRSQPITSGAGNGFNNCNFYGVAKETVTLLANQMIRQARLSGAKL